MEEQNKKEEESKFVPPVADFTFFITTLAIQASISLGIMLNPATNKAEENLDQAKFLLDTIAMLKDKTKGNLTPEEEKLTENILYELRLQYVEKAKGGEKK